MPLEIRPLQRILGQSLALILETRPEPILGCFCRMQITYRRNAQIVPIVNSAKLMNTSNVTVASERSKIHPISSLTVSDK
jgi:hypothetical protein